MKAERLIKMAEHIQQLGYATMEDLCRVFGVSMNTVRRDVGELIAGGGFRKVHGGVVAEAPEEPAELISYSDRNILNVAAKEQICAIAARFIHDRDVIYIDSGSTAAGLTAHLARLEGVTVLTNNLHVILRCMELDRVNVIALGGRLSRSTASFSSSFCALDNLGRFNIRSAFMGATGVSIDKGATHTSPEELDLKREIVARSENRFLLADSAKFGRVAMLTYAGLADFGHVITEGRPPAEYIGFFQDNRIQLLTE